MAGFRAFLKSGHTPTLFAAFFYLMFSFVIWVMNGAMAPFISEQFQLTPAQKGLLLSIPIVAGAIMRFPLGLLAQYVGRKTATLVELGLITFTMCFGYFFVHSYNDLLKMALLLGVAGASFGVAMSLGSGWYPPKYKGLAMGLVGAGNVGTAVAALLAPPLAQAYGWQSVYGIAALASLVPMAVVFFMAKEPPDRDEHASMRDHLACLLEKDGWVFSLIYVVTFGGFIGIVTFLPTYYYDQFGVTKVQAGQLTMLAAFMGAAVRVAGGWISDHWGGVNTLTVRWPMSTAVAGSMIGEIGALGGGTIPALMGQAKQHTGSFLPGFVVLAVFSIMMLALMRKMQVRWTRTWAEKGGRARSA